MMTSDDPATNQRHLSILRKLLGEQTLQKPRLEEAMTRIAAMAKEALDASEAMVALWHASEKKWSAITSRGVQLGHRGVSAHGSRTVLEQVQQTEQSVLTSSKISLEDLQIASHSIESIKIAGVLAVPFFWWDFDTEARSPRLGGCLYAHRIAGEISFVEEDVVLLKDITSIVQPTLNLLHQLERTELVLEASQEEALNLRKAAAASYHLGSYRSRDKTFAEQVLAPLQRATLVERVGIVLLGPTGSGKSHLARCYHYESARKNGPFVVLDCSQVTSMETLTAELFGYAPLSGYANAPQKGRLGKAQLAHQGTLFLDEIGCLPLPLQQQLLRLIETGTFSPLGSSQESKVDIQVVAATHESLPALVKQRLFREDLYWRLAEITINLPTLCQHPADIPALADVFLEHACSHYKRPKIKGFSTDAMETLQQFSWRRAGNIRGLKHTINRSVLMAPSEAGLLTKEHLQFHQVLESETSEHAAFKKDLEVEPRRKDKETFSPSSESSQPSSMHSDSLESSFEENVPSSDAPEEEKHLFMVEKVKMYAGILSEMTQDAGISHFFGYDGAPIPYSSLRLKLQSFGLTQMAKEQRDLHKGTHLTLKNLTDAVRQERSGSAAAKSLGITRAALVWRLRKAGLTLRDILDEEE